MGIAMQTAIMKEERVNKAKRKRFPVFRLTLTQREHIGDAESLLVAAKNELLARQLASSLYRMNVVPNRLRCNITALSDIDRLRWLASHKSLCVQLKQKRDRASVLKIEVRKS